MGAEEALDLIGIKEMHDDGSSCESSDEDKVSSESDLDLEVSIKPTKLNFIIKQSANLTTEDEEIKFKETPNHNSPTLKLLYHCDIPKPSSCKNANDDKIEIKINDISSGEKRSRNNTNQ